MVIQLVNVSIQPEQRDRWLELIRVNAAQTRAEEGCETYRISEDLERPNDFVIVERWASLGTGVRVHPSIQLDCARPPIGSSRLPLYRSDPTSSCEV